MTGIALNINALGNIWMGVRRSPLLSFFPLAHKLPVKLSTNPPVAFLLPGERDKPDGGGRLEDVEVLQDVWNCHQAQGSQEPES